MAISFTVDAIPAEKSSRELDQAQLLYNDVMAIKDLENEMASTIRYFNEVSQRSSDTVDVAKMLSLLPDYLSAGRRFDDVAQKLRTVGLQASTNEIRKTASALYVTFEALNKTILKYEDLREPTRRDTIIFASTLRGQIGNLNGYFRQYVKHRTEADKLAASYGLTRTRMLRCPFDPTTKQYLLECQDLMTREGLAETERTNQ